MILLCHRKLRDFLRPNILDTTKFITCAVSIATGINQQLLNKVEHDTENYPITEALTFCPMTKENEI